MASQYLDFQNWAVGAFVFPFELSIIICSLLTVLMLFITKEISMYKFKRIAFACILLPVSGLIILMLSVVACFVGAIAISTNIILLIPILSIGGFFLVSRLVLSKIFQYMDDKEILFLSILIALLGNPVILFMWDLFGRIDQVLALLFNTPT